LPGESPRASVLRLALAKARACRPAQPDSYILGADTTVVLDGEMLGKPRDDAEAQKVLKMLAGKWHDVLTGVAVCHKGRQAADVASTAVRFTPMTDAEIAWYVATGEPRDKAGSYAVQGLASRFIEGIQGSYSNVVGLPIAVVFRLLKELQW
jgi:septum formation protein